MIMSQPWTRPSLIRLICQYQKYLMPCAEEHLWPGCVQIVFTNCMLADSRIMKLRYSRGFERLWSVSYPHYSTPPRHGGVRCEAWIEAYSTVSARVASHPSLLMDVEGVFKETRTYLSEKCRYCRDSMLYSWRQELQRDVAKMPKFSEIL
jgi:hypothetical protein